MSECESCKNKKNYPCPNSCGYMGVCDSWEAKPLTNADKLCVVNDEEIAEFTDWLQRRLQMSERLTKWEGQDPDGMPRAVLANRDGNWVEEMDKAMRKLAKYEDEEERHAEQLREKGHQALRHHSEEARDDHQRK